MKIKLGEKVVKSPRLLKEEKLEILACIKEEKDTEILEALLHEYGHESSVGPLDSNDTEKSMSYQVTHSILKLKYKACVKRANAIDDNVSREEAISSCKRVFNKYKDYV